MKIEIVHDALAKRIYDKAQDEDKERLKAASFIMQRYNLYINEDDANKNNRLIPDEDLVWVLPFVKTIELSKPIRNFIDLSQSVAKRKEKRRKLFIFLSIFLGATTIITSIILLWQNANYHAKQERVNQAHADSLQVQLDTIQKFEVLIEELRGQLQLQDTDIRSYLVDMKEINDSLQTIRDSLEIYSNVLMKDKERLEFEKQQSALEATLLLQQKQESEKEKQEIEKKRKEEERKRKEAEEEVTKVESRVLSAKANTYYNELDYKEAFHLAAAAWRRDPDNKDACTILNNLSKHHQGYPYGVGNGGSYETIIRQLSQKHYGKEWKERTIKKYLE